MTDTYSRRREYTRAVLLEARGRPVTYAELIARGIDNPGQAVYELELEGEPIMHGAGGVSLALPPGADSVMSRPNA